MPVCVHFFLYWICDYYNPEASTLPTGLLRGHYQNSCVLPWSDRPSRLSLRRICLWKEELSACLNVIQCAKSKATTSWNRWSKVLQFIAWNNLPNRTFLQINEGIALRERCHLHWLWCKHAAQTKAQFVNVDSYLGSSTIQTSRAFTVYVTESETRKVTMFLFQITNIVCIH